MKILILEDNPVYRALLRTKLSTVNIDFQVVAEVDNIADALAVLRAERVDVLLLDINVGQETAFELFERINYQDYEIIFTTGHEDYALAAFDVEAIGYLVKPVSASQLEKFLRIAEQNIATKEKSQRQTLESAQKKRPISQTTLSVPTESGFDIIPVDSIVRCEAINSTTHIFLSNDKRLISAYNIGRFLDMLSDKDFLLVHRSHIINLTFVLKYLRTGVIVMKDNTQIPVSKVHRQGFIEIFRGNEK